MAEVITKVGLLIQALRAVEDCAEIKTIYPEELKDIEEGYSNEDLHPLVQEVINQANDCLITELGNCNWAAHNVLGDAGFPVSCGEKDCCGWLTGLIKTSKGFIVYG